MYIHLLKLFFYETKNSTKEFCNLTFHVAETLDLTICAWFVLICGCCSTFLSASRTVSGVLTHPIIPCTERVISFLLRMVALRECPLLLARNVWTSCHPHWDGTAAPLHQSPAAWPTSHCLFCKNLYMRKWNLWLVQIICIIFTVFSLKRKIKLVDCRWKCAWFYSQSFQETFKSGIDGWCLHSSADYPLLHL